MSDTSTNEIMNGEVAPVTSYGRLPLPPLSKALKPSYFLKFVEYWFFSRNRMSLFLGLPSALTAIAGVLFLVYLKHDNQSEAVEYYRKEFNKAVDAEEWKEALLYQHAMCSLRPSNAEYRWALAALYDKLGNKERAVGLMQVLAPLDSRSRGYPKARLWLVDNSSAAGFPLSREDRKKHLQRAVRESTKYKDTSVVISANQRLAQVYLGEQKFQLAAECYKTSARFVPEDYLILADLQQQMNKGSSTVNATLEKARTAFQNQIARSENADARVNWARSYVIQRKFNEAEEVLQQGLQELPENDELAEARAEVRVNVAREILRTKGASNYAAGLQLIEALKIFPGKMDAIRFLASLPAGSIVVTPKQIEGALEHWKREISEQPEDVEPHEMYCQLLEICGEHETAIQTLTPVVEKHSSLRQFLARAYLRNNQQDKADRIYDVLIEETHDDESLNEAQAAYRIALLQWEATRYDDAISTLEKTHPEVDGKVQTAIADQLGRLLVLRSRQFLMQEEDESTVALELAVKAMDVLENDRIAIYQLSAISCSSKSAAEESEKKLIRLLAEGTYNWDVFYTLGEHALVSKQYSKAQRNLEAANDISKTDKEARIQILNNLALAILRGEDPDLDRCLNLINEVMDLLPEQKHPDAYSTRAEIYIKLRRFKEADRDLQKALPQRPNSQKVHELLIVVKDELGETALANEHRHILTELQSAEEASGQGDE